MNIVQSLVVCVAFTAASLISLPAIAQATMDHSKMGDMKMDMSKDMAEDMTDGEVRQVDKKAGKVTIKHGNIKNLDMPGMTMAFPVDKKTLLNKVKAGDKIKFRVVQEDGKLVVTEIRTSW